MWNFLLALFVGSTVGSTRAAQRLVRPLLILFALGILVAGLIYTFVVLKAVSERTTGPHVHTKHSR